MRAFGGGVKKGCLRELVMDKKVSLLDYKRPWDKIFLEIICKKIVVVGIFISTIALLGKNLEGFYWE